MFAVLDVPGVAFPGFGAALALTGWQEIEYGVVLFRVCVLKGLRFDCFAKLVVLGGMCVFCGWWKSCGGVVD